MTKIFQVGTGSGGMVVLDLLCRDERVAHIVLVEPDIYKPHNVVRHFFPPRDVGQRKADLAARWLHERRPDLKVDTLAINLLDPAQQAMLEEAARSADIGVCAADNEPAKFHSDALMRMAGKPWTLGEVLSGGIGGWVHRFTPGGPCYGCVASHLNRTVTTDTTSPPADYADANGAVAETTIPASKASIDAIASWHALVTIGMLGPGHEELGFTSVLVPFTKVEGVFPEAFKPYRFRIERSPACLICSPPGNESLSGEALDAALNQALARLVHE
jgi:molybdopterin/thiamine biosynthesis adenylyltransferase